MFAGKSRLKITLIKAVLIKSIKVIYKLAMERKERTKTVDEKSLYAVAVVFLTILCGRLSGFPSLNRRARGRFFGVSTKPCTVLNQVKIRVF